MDHKHKDNFTQVCAECEARRPRGNPPGSKRVAEPRNRTLTQRYTEAEARLLESVAPGEVGGFIREVAVDRARQIVEAEVAE